MKCNDYEKMMVRILGNEFCINSLELSELENWQSNWLCIKYIGLFVNDELFINNDAKKIFQNILINGCEFEEKIHFSKKYYPNIIIDTREMDYLECLKKIEIVQIIIDRANAISEIIRSEQVNKQVEQGLLTKYKMLIQGLKSTYDKGLILVKLLFKDVNNDNLLFKYYQLIHKKEDIEVRRGIFYELLFIEDNKLVKKHQKLKNVL